MIGVSLWQIAFQLSGPAVLAAAVPLYLLALLKGNKDSRHVAHVLAIGAVLDTLFATSARHAIGDQLGIDALLLAALTVLALRAQHHFPIVIAAMQLLIFSTDALAATSFIAEHQVLLWLICGPAIIQLGTFVAAIIAHQFRHSRHAGPPLIAA